jgi:sugar O-acyltransferase (sialic acid O-acetyltransferase NeuD family)
MTNILPVTIPLLNPNETDAVLANLQVTEGQKVVEGDIICTIETTKSTAELQAEREGYVVGLFFRQGDFLQAGELLCYISESPDWEPPSASVEDGRSSDSVEVPTGLRITQPALNLARQYKIALDQFPVGPLVTEDHVRNMIDKIDTIKMESPESDFDSTAIIIYGGGGHGKSLIDLVHSLGAYRIAGIVDDAVKQGSAETIIGIPVLGGRKILPELHTQGIRQAVNAVGGIGNVQVRVEVFQHLAEAGFICPAVVHPTAYVEPSASLSAGVQVFPQAYIGSDTELGYGTIVNSGAIVSHDCVLAEYVNISPGAILAGEVNIGRGCLIGMGSTVNLAVTVNAGARIGNGATVKRDVPDNQIVRAGSVWPE